MGENGREWRTACPEEEYRAGHIAGARSVPLERLEAYLEEIPGDHEVVAYCRGPYCVFSDEAVKLLNSRGYQASRLIEGFPSGVQRDCR